MSGPLRGCSIWLTRPQTQAAVWAAAFEAVGARVTTAPLIEIAGPAAPNNAIAALHRAIDADIVIATSANAVSGLVDLVGAWQPSGRLLAVGAATAAALAAHVGRAVETPARSDSEGLLDALDQAAITGQRVAILAGEGGRIALADGLAARGAIVEKITLYRRVAIDWPQTRLDALLDRNDVIVLTSDAAWQALIAQCDTMRRNRLAKLSLVAASLRVVQQTWRDIDWRHAPIVIEAMGAAGAQAAVIRAWQANR